MKTNKPYFAFAVRYAVTVAQFASQCLCQGHRQFKRATKARKRGFVCTANLWQTPLTLEKPESIGGGKRSATPVITS
jgi:hypothetical protein